MRWIIKFYSVIRNLNCWIWSFALQRESRRCVRLEFNFGISKIFSYISGKTAPFLFFFYLKPIKGFPSKFREVYLETTCGDWDLIFSVGKTAFAGIYFIPVQKERNTAEMLHPPDENWNITVDPIPKKSFLLIIFLFSIDIDIRCYHEICFENCTPVLLKII